MLLLHGSWRLTSVICSLFCMVDCCVVLLLLHPKVVSPWTSLCCCCALACCVPTGVLYKFLKSTFETVLPLQSFIVLSAGCHCGAFFKFFECAVWFWVHSMVLSAHWYQVLVLSTAFEFHLLVLSTTGYCRLWEDPVICVFIANQLSLALWGSSWVSSTSFECSSTEFNWATLY